MAKADRTPFNDAATASAADSTAMNPGQVIAYAGLTAPAGFLECNGAEVSKSQYSALSNILGTRFGTAAAGKFKLPNAAGGGHHGGGRHAGVGRADCGGFEVRGEHHQPHYCTSAGAPARR